MSVSQTFILKKLEEIDGYIDEVKDLLQSSDREILESSGKMHIAERLTQLIVDSMIDINNHIIKESQLKLAEDIQSTFYTLSDNGLLPKDLAFRLSPIAGLRNRIVHRYDELDKGLFIRTLRKEYIDFQDYNKEIEKYITNHK